MKIQGPHESAGTPVACFATACDACANQMHPTQVKGKPGAVQAAAHPLKPDTLPPPIDPLPLLEMPKNGSSVSKLGGFSLRLPGDTAGKME